MSMYMYYIDFNFFQLKGEKTRGNSMKQRSASLS